MPRTLLDRLLRWFALLIIAALLLGGGAYASMRLHDGPVEFWPWFTISIGGPFQSGELTASPQDWNFIQDRDEIEIQTLDPQTSRTVWVPVVDGQLYIVSGYMTSPLGRLWKQWPTYLARDNRILIRVDDRIYEQRLQRITEGAITDRVMSEVAHKYAGAPDRIIPGAGQSVTNGSVWLFEVVDR